MQVASSQAFLWSSFTEEEGRRDGTRDQSKCGGRLINNLGIYQNESKSCVCSYGCECMYIYMHTYTCVYVYIYLYMYYIYKCVFTEGCVYTLFMSGVHYVPFELHVHPFINTTKRLDFHVGFLGYNLWKQDDAMIQFMKIVALFVISFYPFPGSFWRRH